MLNITEGKIQRPLKAVIYGSEGIGKTTFAAEFPEPLFIDTEGGTAHLDVRRITAPPSWEELLAVIREVANTKGICKTLVLDTADWAEALCVNHILAKYHQTSIESFGYGKGYTYLAEEFGRLLSALDEVIHSGKHVVLTAHAKMRKFEQPDEQGAYDRWEMKLSRQVAPLLKEWCDMLLFLNYKTYVITTELNTKKAQGGKRVMYTSHHPCWDAKNRQGLEDELDLDFKNISHLFEEEARVAKNTTQSATPQEDLKALMERDGITEEELQKVIAERGHYAKDAPVSTYADEFIEGYCMRHWEKIVTRIKDGRKAEK